MKLRLQKELDEFQVLLRSVPATCMVFFVISICFMNLTANKELLSVSWVALDCGFTMSWISFLAMDTIVKRFGAKASIELSIFAECINLLFSGILFLLSLVPQNWGEFYTYGISEVNAALNSTIGGTWYVVLGSTTAFIVSSVVNAFVNQAIGSRIKETHFKAYALRSFVSTFIGQFVDNLLFAYIVSLHFFGWTHLQCWVCALTGAVCELLCEVIFSPVGYRASVNWEKDSVGKEYLDLVSGI